jgi:hypothetical protein
MGTLFVDSLDDQRAPGVVAAEIAPPRVIEGITLGYFGYPFQAGWGPPNVVTEPVNTQEFLDTYFIAGSPRDSSGYRGIMRRRKLALRPIRVVNMTGAAASAVTATAGSGDYTATALYVGTDGDRITLVWKAATDGVTAHRDLVVTMLNATTGLQTQERIRNIAFGTDLNPPMNGASASKLLASLTFDGADALPAVDTTASLTGGSNGGSVAASHYTTALGLLAARSDILVVAADDCGNTIRADVNAALVAHVRAKRNRIAVIQAGNPDASWSTVKSAVSGASWRDERVIIESTWRDVADDASVLRTSPGATFIASALAGLEPQQSHAWWDRTATVYYDGVSAVRAPFDTADDDIRAEATDLGLTMGIRLEDGSFAVLHDRTSNLTAGRRFTITRRLRDFFARSIVAALPSYVNGGNWKGKQVQIKGIVDRFMRSQSPTGRPEEPRVLEFASDINSVNTAASVALGRFRIKIDGTTPSVMEKLGLMMNLGESVVVEDAQ